jgi:chemotaxis protein methyltransferase CheR
MTAASGFQEVERLRAIVARRLGLHVDEARLDVLQGVLARRAKEHRQPCDRYLDALERTPHTDEFRALACELTVNETYFFRNPDHYRALVETVLPERIAARASERALHVLSAGCASGEEAYSLAIVLREHASDPTFAVTLRAFDINPGMLVKAERARYSAWALRETPPSLQQRYFENRDGEFVLKDAIRSVPRFYESNLLHEDRRIWTPATYDAVFCRNVIMYLTPAAAEEAVARITRALVPGGYLFLGHAETLRGLSHDYDLRHAQGTFFYRRKDASAREGRPSVQRAEPSASPAWADSWVETVERASQRIERLTRDSCTAPGVASAAAPAGAGAPPQLGPALELLEQERYEAALESLGAPGASPDPDTLLLRAVLLTHAGRLEAAASACVDLLAIDALSTGAHYVLALCSEGAGDRRRAMDHDRMAIHLDPSFAMPRLHLGLMARKLDDRETARRELSQAMMLLQREDAARLLLFGGGFNRDALTALCRVELAAAGGDP